MVFCFVFKHKKKQANPHPGAKQHREPRSATEIGRRIVRAKLDLAMPAHRQPSR